MLSIVNTVEPSQIRNTLVVPFPNTVFVVELFNEIVDMTMKKRITIKENGVVIAGSIIYTSDNLHSFSVIDNIISIKLKSIFKDKFNLVVFDVGAQEIGFTQLPSCTYVVNREGTVFVENYKGTDMDTKKLGGSKEQHLVLPKTLINRRLRMKFCYQDRKLELVCGKLVFITKCSDDEGNTYMMYNMKGELVDWRLPEIYSSKWTDRTVDKSKEKHYFCSDGSLYFMSPSNELMTCTTDDVVIPVELSDEDRDIIFKDTGRVYIEYVNKTSSALTICLCIPNTRKRDTMYYVLQYSASRTKSARK